jgi:two-component system, LytTR family, response regulator
MNVTNRLRIVIADDERPARSFLASILRSYEDIDIVGEASDGAEAVEMIEKLHPDLALLDLQMPEIDGLGVIRLLRKNNMPLIAFITAYDEYAVKAFELNAIDYLLKPVDAFRLRETLNRAQERLEKVELRYDHVTKLRSAATEYEANSRLPFLERIPVRRRDEILILPVKSIASIIADGELLHISTNTNERYSFNYRLKDIEARLNPNSFVRLGRGVLVNIDMITRINPMPGGTYLVTLTTGQQLNVSRLQSRILREQLLRL